MADGTDKAIEACRLFEGDSLDVLRTIADGTYTAVVTDPPYGLSAPPDPWDVVAQWVLCGDFTRTKRGRTKAPPPGMSEIAARFAKTAGPGGFLGAKWDSFVPPPNLWSQVFRVCKPGAIALVFAARRTQHWMALSLALAGFEILDVIGWVTAQGMAKSGTVDKRIDRRRDDRAAVLRCTAWIRERCEALGLTPRDLDAVCGTNGMGSHWTSSKSQPYVPTREQWAKLESLFGPMPSEMETQRTTIDARELGEDWGKREIVGFHDRVHRGGDVGLAPRSDGFNITTSASDHSGEWEGWSTQLAPAIEPIIVARRPCEGKSAVANVLKYGCGAMNIDACRKGAANVRRMNRAGIGYMQDALGTPDVVTGSEDGRWPKNLLLDDAAAELLDRMTGERKSGSRRAGVRGGMGYGSNARGDGGPAIAGSTGNVSRYFWVGPCATDDDVLLPFRYVSKITTTSYRHAGLPEGAENKHPTLKPIELMRWLCRLVGHPRGRILEPFAGSGSTLVAARAEGFACDGIEREAEYARIARLRTGLARLRDYAGLPRCRLPQDPRSLLDELLWDDA